MLRVLKWRRHGDLGGTEVIVAVLLVKWVYQTS